jgi:hypothetical protein
MFSSLEGFDNYVEFFNHVEFLITNKVCTSLQMSIFTIGLTTIIMVYQ